MYINREAKHMNKWSLYDSKIHGFLSDFTRVFLILIKSVFATFAKLGIAFLHAKKIEKCFFRSFK